MMSRKTFATAKQHNCGLRRMLTDMRAELQIDPDEALFDRMSAHKTREDIVANLEHVLLDPATAERGDLKWIHATLANCHFALGNDDTASTHELKFRAFSPALWEIATFEDGRTRALVTGRLTKQGR